MRVLYVLPQIPLPLEYAKYRLGHASKLNHGIVSLRFSAGFLVLDPQHSSTSRLYIIASDWLSPILILTRVLIGCGTRAMFIFKMASTFTFSEDIWTQLLQPTTGYKNIL